MWKSATPVTTNNCSIQEPARIIPDPPLSCYRAYHQPGDVFVACATLRAEPIFCQAGMAHLLRSVLRKIQGTLQFRMHGWAILPHQCQFLLRPAQDVLAQQILQQVWQHFQMDCAQARGQPAPVVVWDQQHQIEPVPDLPRFALCLDRLHYAPVAQGLCARPEEWLQSSYSAWVERGLYKLGWGWAVPERLAAVAHDQ